MPIATPAIAPPIVYPSHLCGTISVGSGTATSVPIHPKPRKPMLVFHLGQLTLWEIGSNKHTDLNSKG